MIADRSTVALDLDEVSTDLEDLLSAPDDQATVEAYRGKFLPEDRYDDWSAGPRDEARSRYRAAAGRLAADAVAERRWEPDAGLARRLIEADPYDADGHRCLVLALTGGGSLGAARRAHQRWCDAADELGTSTPPFEQLVTDGAGT